jgi:hypothetical protein
MEPDGETVGDDVAGAGVGALAMGISGVTMLPVGMGVAEDAA